MIFNYKLSIMKQNHYFLTTDFLKRDNALQI